MKTKDALSALSKGEHTAEYGSDSPLAAHSERFLAQDKIYNEAIAQKKAEIEIKLPIFDSIKRKIAKSIDAPNANMPVVTKFDLHIGIAKTSSRAPTDAGLRRLSARLNNEWHQDPLGVMNYGDVSSMIKFYKDQYPISKAADAIEAECSKVGLHKLPVAKLARMASRIESQSDYETAIKTAGLNGDKPEQVRARSFVRQLVAMRGGSATEDSEKDIGQRMANRIAQMPQIEEEKPIDKISPFNTGMDKTPDDLDGDVDVAPESDLPEPTEDEPGELMHDEEGVEQSVGIINEIEQEGQRIIQEAPPEAKSYTDKEIAEGHGVPGTAEWGANEMLEEDEAGNKIHDAVPPSEEWVQQEIEEMMEGGPANDDTSMPLEIPKAACLLPDSEGRFLTAAMVEGEILDGRLVTVGETSILINASTDTVELWHKDAGRGCDLSGIDAAIADFIAISNEAGIKHVASHVDGKFDLLNVIDIPCSNCSTVSKVATNNESGEEVYTCKCGNKIKTASVEEVSSIMGIAPKIALVVNVAPFDGGKFDGIRQRLLTATLSSLGVKPRWTSTTKLSATVDSARIASVVAAIENLGLSHVSDVDAGTSKTAQYGPGYGSMAMGPRPSRDPSAPSAPKGPASPKAPAAPQKYKPGMWDRVKDWGLNKFDELGEKMNIGRINKPTKLPPGSTVKTTDGIYDGQGYTLIPAGSNVTIKEYGPDGSVIIDSGLRDPSKANKKIKPYPTTIDVGAEVVATQDIPGSGKTPGITSGQKVRIVKVHGDGSVTVETSSAKPPATPGDDESMEDATADVNPEAAGDMKGDAAVASLNDAELANKLMKMSDGGIVSMLMQSSPEGRARIQRNIQAERVKEISGKLKSAEAEKAQTRLDAAQAENADLSNQAASGRPTATDAAADASIRSRENGIPAGERKPKGDSTPKDPKAGQELLDAIRSKAPKPTVAPK